MGDAGCQSRWWPGTWRLSITFQREKRRRVTVGVFGAQQPETSWGKNWPVAAGIGERRILVVNMVRNWTSSNYKLLLINQIAHSKERRFVVMGHHVNSGGRYSVTYTLFIL